MAENKLPSIKSLLIFVIVLFALITALIIAINFPSFKNYPLVTVQPTVEPTPVVDISDWKTYRNEEYGYEFKYPEKIVQAPISFVSSRNPVAFSSFSYKVDSIGMVTSGFDISIEKDKAKKFEQGSPSGIIGTIDREVTKFLGYKANIFTIDNDKSKYYGYEVLKDDNLFYIYIRYGLKNDNSLIIFNNFISTFKFIN